MDKVLINYIKLISIGKIIDLGVGESETSLYLSYLGFDVEVVDILDVVIDSYIKKATRYDVNVKTKVIDIRDLELIQNSYDLVIASNSLHFLNKVEIDTILSKIRNSLKMQGMFYFRTASDTVSKFDELSKSSGREGNIVIIYIDFTKKRFLITF